MRQAVNFTSELHQTRLGQENAGLGVTGNPFDVREFGKRANVLLRIVPVALAGGGSVTQTTQIDEWLNILSKQHNVPVRRIRVAGHYASFVDEQITGTIYPLDRSIEQAVSVSGIYHNVTKAITDEVHYLYSMGVRNLAGVCCGYTSYGLFALKHALEEINTAHLNDRMTGKIIIQDSSFPDIDALSTELDDKGYPVTRFH